MSSSHTSIILKCFPVLILHT